jgi:serine/threonine protein phosphatase 1
MKQYSLNFENDLKRILAKKESVDLAICFGDIHGHRNAAITAVSLAEITGVAAVFLGDFVDRGPDSLGVLNVVMEASERHPNWVFLLGNHDLMLMHILEGKRHPEGFDGRTFNDTLPAILPDHRPKILRWLRNRPIFHKRGEVIFLHGGFTKPNVCFETASTEELVWTYGIPEDWKGPTIVRGHLLVEEPQITLHDININTSCGFGGYLTGLLLDGSTAKPLWIWKISEDGEILSDGAAEELR